MGKLTPSSAIKQEEKGVIITLAVELKTLVSYSIRAHQDIIIHQVF